MNRNLLAGLVVLVTALTGLGVAASRAEAPVVDAKDKELARLLVGLELRTRAVIAGHYTRAQAGGMVATNTYKKALIDNLILPAAVADGVFHETVPQETGGRAWVKMIVDEPRNPHNRGDEITSALLAEIKGGAKEAERQTPAAYYYARPIVAVEACMPCHGTPAATPDPHFPQYQKDGWKVGQVIGAVTARVAP